MYADRTILSPVQGLIREEFALNNAEVGLVSSVFFLVYTLVQIPSGLLGDRFGRTKIIFIGFLIFGFSTALTGLVASFSMLLLVRVMAGFGEGFYYGPQYAVSTESTPEQFRALGYAIINSGQAFGISLGLIGSSYIAFELNHGWRMSFYLFAIPTLLVGLLILLFVKDGVKAKKTTATEGTTKAGSTASVLEILKNANLTKIFFVEFCSVYGFFVMVTWLPLYLFEVHHIPHEQTGAISSLVAWTSIPAALLIARVSDKLKARKSLLLLLIPIAILSVLSLTVVSSWSLMIASLVLYGVVGKLACDPLLLALTSDHAPKDKMSTVYGMYNCIAMIGAILAPYLTGWLKDSTSSFNSGFYLSIVLLALGWFATLSITKPKTPAP